MSSPNSPMSLQTAIRRADRGASARVRRRRSTPARPIGSGLGQDRWEFTVTNQRNGFSRPMPQIEAMAI